LFFSSDDWEVLDSFINLSTEIVRRRFEQIPVDLLFSFAHKHVEHSNSFIRASTVQLMFELLNFDEVLKEKFDVENFVGDIFLFETEAIVRRVCSKSVIRFGAKNFEIRRIMIRALWDLDWEVKEEVREFLKKFITKLSRINFIRVKENHLNCLGFC
jgi:hypothetical protein